MGISGTDGHCRISSGSLVIGERLSVRALLSAARGVKVLVTPWPLALWADEVLSSVPLSPPFPGRTLAGLRAQKFSASPLPTGLPCSTGRLFSRPAPFVSAPSADVIP